MTLVFETGGELDAWCTKCKMHLTHTIIAMVDSVPKRVKCNTCGGQHNYRPDPSERSRIKPKGPSRKRGAREALHEEYVSRLAASDPSLAKKYSLRGVFSKDEIVDHPRFGMGIVVSVPSTFRVEVLFKDGVRLLGQNQGAGDRRY
ncbi:MAG: hypothetical protein JSU90_07640 [Nitrospiraceae bacterium]|nr:MAG: hypothetical protein JSU90_07640 [Nitrospiraceae bacterium]